MRVRSVLYGLDKMFYEFISSHTFAPTSHKAPLFRSKLERRAFIWRIVRGRARAAAAVHESLLAPGIVHLRTSGICSEAGACLFLRGRQRARAIAALVILYCAAAMLPARSTRGSLKYADFKGRLSQIGFIFQRLPRSRNRSPSGLKAKAGASRQKEERENREAECVQARLGERPSPLI